MERLNATLGQIMQRLERQRQPSSKDNPQALLERALSKKELQHIRLHYFKKGILSLEVDSSSWLYQCTLKKADLLARLSKEKLAVSDIRFQLGGMQCPAKRRIKK